MFHPLALLTFLTLSATSAPDVSLILGSIFSCADAILVMDRIAVMVMIIRFIPEMCEVKYYFSIAEGCVFVNFSLLYLYSYKFIFHFPIDNFTE